MINFSSRITFYAVVWLLVFTSGHADTLVGRVISVADGDTITVLTDNKSKTKVRLAAIDAPEDGQEYSKKSKEALAAIVAGKIVTVRVDGMDRYGRTIGWVRVENVDVNLEMVRQGWAWHFIKYNQDPQIAQLQKEAKNAFQGLWSASNPPVAPWSYRVLKRNYATNTNDSTKLQNLNQQAFWINSNGVRHNSGCRWFSNTKKGRYGTKSEGKACAICGG